MSATIANSVITVDLRTVKTNIEKIRQYIGKDVELMVTIKSNGYGHGLIEPARYIRENCGVDKFATSMVCEALDLRDAGIDGYLMVLGGIPYSAVPAVVEQDLVVPCYDAEFMRLLNEEAARKGKKVKVHIKLDTGLRRLGVRVGDELSRLVDSTQPLGNVDIEGIFTHLACPRTEDNSFTNKQLDEFDVGVAQARAKGLGLRYVHVANSDAVARCPRSYYNLVRPAALWLGYDETGKVGVKPCIQWKTFVSNVLWAEAGESISYFGKTVMKKRTRVAVLGFGGGDGYVRNLISPDPLASGMVIIRGKRVPLLAMNMDQAYADVTDVEDVKINDEVILLGGVGDQEITMDTLGRIAGTSTGHIQCSLGSRPFREYVR